MKKVLLVLALVVAYGVSISTASAKVVTVDNAKTVIVADLNDDNSVVAPEGEKEKKEKAEAKTAKAKGEGCATAKSEAKAEGCAGKSEAKAEGCAGKEKTATAEVTKAEKK